MCSFFLMGEPQDAQASFILIGLSSHYGPKNKRPS